MIRFVTWINTPAGRKIKTVKKWFCRSQWPCGLRRRSTAARPLRLWVRIPPSAWMFVCCECCVLSGRGLCDGLVTRPEESYRLWRVVVCDLEASKMRLKPATGLWKIQPKGCNAKKTNKKVILGSDIDTFHTNVCTNYFLIIHCLLVNLH